jgi:hypothetical protein
VIAGWLAARNHAARPSRPRSPIILTLVALAAAHLFFAFAAFLLTYCTQSTRRARYEAPPLYQEMLMKTRLLPVDFSLLLKLQNMCA